MANFHRNKYVSSKNYLLLRFKVVGIVSLNNWFENVLKESEKCVTKAKMFQMLETV